MIMSSMKPNQKVVSVDLDPPFAGTAATTFPSQVAGCRQRPGECFLRADVEADGFDVRIGVTLLERHLAAAVFGGVGGVLAQREDGDEAGWMVKVGADVVNRRDGTGRGLPGVRDGKN